MWAISIYKNYNTHKIESASILDDVSGRVINIDSKRLKNFILQNPCMIYNLKVDNYGNIKLCNSYPNSRKLSYTQEYYGNTQVNHYCIITEHRYGTLSFVASGIDGSLIHGEYCTLGELACSLGIADFKDLRLFNAVVEIEKGIPRIYIYLGGRLTKLGQVQLKSVNNIFENEWDVEINCITQEGIKIDTIEHTYGAGVAQIPNGVCHINKFCGGVNRLELPSSVHTLGNGCFSGIDDLETLKFGQGLAIVPKECCFDSPLKRVIFSGSETEIGNLAFGYCSKLSGTIITNAYKIGNEAFLETGIKSVKLEKTTYIGIRAFKYCKKLETLTLNDGLKHIGNNAFEGCTRLEKVTIPSTVDTVGNNAFKDCRKLKSVFIAHGTKIGRNAFDKRTKIVYY